MLVYNDIGKRTGIPILYIHGLGSRKEAWIPQHELANRYRLIIPDLRSHGRSFNGEVSLYNFAADIVKLLDYLEIKSAFLCGLSLGGIIAQEIYKQRPDLVKGLILANTTSYVPWFFGNLIVEEKRRILQQYGKDALVDKIVSGGLHNKLYKEEAKNAFLIRENYLESARAPLGHNYFPMLHSINKPVLLIGGTYDTVCPIFNVYLMKFFMWRAHVRILHTSHLSNIEDRLGFNRHVIEFIEGC